MTLTTAPPPETSTTEACCVYRTRHLDVLRTRVRDWAGELRATSAVLQRNPADAGPLLDHEGPRWLATAGIPQRYGAAPLRVGGHRYDGCTAAERVVVMEELSRVDPSLVVAAPGGSMAGVLLAALGDENQRTRFYTRLLETPTWTFFALTEPDHGSDAGALQSAVTVLPDGELTVTGEKRYIGNAARAAMGVVFARERPGPLGIGAYLHEAPTTGLTATPLPMVGLRPVQICQVSFEAVRVPAENVLGRHLPRSRRGLHACLAVFNRLRPGVAAGALELYDELEPAPGPLAAARRIEWSEQVSAVRRLVVEAADVVDRTGDGSLAAVAKASACQLAERLTLDVCQALGPGARFTRPELDRAVRDARGLEFMEGTQNMQLLTAFHGLSAGRLGPPRPAGSERSAARQSTVT